MPSKTQSRVSRFQLRLAPHLLETLKQRAARQQMPLNHYIANALEAQADQEATYHQVMASKHAFMAYAMINILAATQLPAETRKDVMRAIGEQADRLFGANPPIPDSISHSMSVTDPAYVQELFSLFHRFASRR